MRSTDELEASATVRDVVRFWQRRPRIMRCRTLVLWIAVTGCASNDPAPGPEPAPEPTLHRCAGDHDCPSGVPCRDGTCRAWALDITIGAPTCSPACSAPQMCADGRCVGYVTRVDAGGLPTSSARHGAVTNADPSHE